MKSVADLCEIINFPNEVKEKVLSYYSECGNDCRKKIETLFEKGNKKEGIEELKRCVSSDEDGLKLMTLLLIMAAYTSRAYEERKLPDDIFCDTVRCFGNYVDEYRKIHGVYGFSREEWIWKHLTVRMFRIGNLCFELDRDKKTEKPVVEVHIETDSTLDFAPCREAYDRSKVFIQKYFPSYVNAPYRGQSWLLSPNLKHVLPKASRILKWADEFILDEFVPDNDAYLHWVFRDKNLSDAPQDTKLQRNMKKFVLQGGKIGEGIAHLKAEPFKED